jgi:HEPN domain-containing protein
MATGATLRRIAKARLLDAEVLFEGRRYHGALYVCGYAVELALKARICRTLDWREYLTSKDYQSFRTHDLMVLLSLTGEGERIRGGRHMFAWSEVMRWTPEIRYDPVGSVTRQRARRMIENSRAIVEAL